MDLKIIKRCLLILTVAFLLLGAAFIKKAEDYKGVSVSTGTMIDGEFSKITSGKIGEDRERYNFFNKGGTIFFVCAGAAAGIWIVLSVKQKIQR